VLTKRNRGLRRLTSVSIVVPPTAAGERQVVRAEPADLRRRAPATIMEDVSRPASDGPYTQPTTADELFKQTYAGLVSILSVAAGSRHEAEDAVQHAFEQALGHWAVVRDYDNPAAWVRRVATNWILDRGRKERRQLRLRSFLSTPEEQRPVPEPMPELQRAIASLPIQQRTAIVLYYLADLATHDVAESMAISEPTVRFHLHAARRSLAALLGEDDA